MESLSKNNLFSLTLTVAIILEAISILELVWTPSIALAAPDPFIGLMVWVFNFLIPLSPFLLLALLYFPLVRAVVSLVRRRSQYINHRFEELSSLWKISWGSGPYSSHEGLGLLDHPRAVLIVSMSVAALLAYFPYRPDVNPQQILVGIDTFHYVIALNQMLGRPVLYAIVYAFNSEVHGSRVLLLLVAYAFARLGNLDATVVFKFLPMILAPLLVFTSYSFGLLGSGSRHTAVIAGIMAAFSPILTVGIWAGYYANWLGIIETYAFLGVLLLHIQAPTNPRFLLAVGLSVAILLTHPWTWFIVVAVTFTFLFSLRNEIRPRRVLKIAGSVLAAGLTTEFLWSILLGGFGMVASAKDVVGRASEPFSIFGAFLPNVVSALLFVYAGLLANSVLFALALLMVTTMRYGDRFERILFLWVLLTSLAFPFYGDLVQSRLVYDLPITVMASVALLRITLNAPFKNVDRNLILLVVILFNANYALLAVAKAPLL